MPASEQPVQIPHLPAPERRLFCNRTLNLRAIKVVGYDMDYTLVHYAVEAWEQRAYEYLQAKLLEQGWPVEDLSFRTGFATRGLVIDTRLGNIVKADRFGYVKRAVHGTARLDFEQQRRTYAREQVDLDDPRWVFLNTFFSLSEACMYAQLVERLDAGRFAAVFNYSELWARVRRALDEAHAEGRLKAEVLEAPQRYLVDDPDVAQTLLDQKGAGKKLVLVTNSEFAYTQAILRTSLDPHLPAGTTWRDVFDLVIAGARKPEFFSDGGPLFEVVNEEGLLRPCVAGPTRPGVYVGGHAGLVEEYFGVSGSDILYVGDHLYTDVHASKNVRRWRTCLIVRELEEELAQQQARSGDQARLDALMAEKAALEYEQAQWRLHLQRSENGKAPAATASLAEARLARLRARLDRLDEEIGPLAASLGSLSNETWGPLMYAGNDRSLLAQQLESHADIYTSRVSNFLLYTPFAYLRAPRGRLPHDTIAPAAPA